MARAARSLVRAFEYGSIMDAREDMCVASLFSGLALANAGLGAVHGFAAPLGGTFSAPHGAVCAALLPHVVRMNIAALQQRLPQSPVLLRYEKMAQILTQNKLAMLNDGVCWLLKTCRNLKVLPLRSYGIKPDDFEVLTEKASQASSMKANPIVLTREELTGILQNAW
jgi:alcohol dehydrogenase class IV